MKQRVFRILRDQKQLRPQGDKDGVERVVSRRLPLVYLRRCLMVVGI